MEAAHPPVTFNKRNERSLADRAAPKILALAGVLIGFLAAEIGLISLDNFVGSAEWRGVNSQLGHRLANPMPEKPRGFHAAPQRALDLPRGEAFLRGAKQVDHL